MEVILRDDSLLYCFRRFIDHVIRDRSVGKHCLDRRDANRRVGHTKHSDMRITAASVSVVPEQRAPGDCKITAAAGEFLNGVMPSRSPFWQSDRKNQLVWLESGG